MPKLHIKKEDSEITLFDENDIQDKLNEKLDISDAFSGDYDDLSNKPDILSITLITDTDEIDDNGIYFLKEEAVD